MPWEVVETPSLKVSIVPDSDQAAGTWFSVGLSSARFMVGFNALISSFQTKLLLNSFIPCWIPLGSPLPICTLNPDLHSTV